MVFKAPEYGDFGKVKGVNSIVNIRATVVLARTVIFQRQRMGDSRASLQLFWVQ